MRYENEEKFAKKQLRKKAVEANRESRKKAERRGSAVSISADVDQTLSYGDWKILEPGNFGSQVKHCVCLKIFNGVEWFLLVLEESYKLIISI